MSVRAVPEVPSEGAAARSLRPATLAIFGVFFCESVVLGNWIPRIPDIKAALGLSDSMLGLCLLAMPAGSLVGLGLAGRLVERFGLRASCRLGLVSWALLFTPVAFAGSPIALAAALFVAGTAIAFVEVAMNTEADRIEAARGRRIMSRCHGFWSLGSMTGALLGAALAQAGAGVQAHFLSVMPALALLGWAIASRLPPDVLVEGVAAPTGGAATAPLRRSEAGAATSPAAGDPAVAGERAEGGVGGVAARAGSRTVADGRPVDTDDERIEASAPGGHVPAAEAGREPLFRLPSRAILALCAMPLGIMVVEGAFIDWSAVFMRSVLDASPLVIGIAYAFFSSVMAATRLAGDRIADRLGDLAVVRRSGLAATAGVALFALAPNVPIAFAGAALAGAGVAIVYPLAVTAAARRPGRSAADNVAALTMISFSAFLFGPPLIGFLSDAFGLRVALALLAPLAFATVLLAGEVAPGRGR